MRLYRVLSYENIFIFAQLREHLKYILLSDRYNWVEIENYTMIPNIHSFGILITDNHCMEHFEKLPLQHARSQVGCVRVCVGGGGGGGCNPTLIFVHTKFVVVHKRIMIWWCSNVLLWIFRIIAVGRNFCLLPIPVVVVHPPLAENDGRQ
jgi:hypothetical protein